jgi:hypothetical protein
LQQHGNASRKWPSRQTSSFQPRSLNVQVWAEYERSRLPRGMPPPNLYRYFTYSQDPLELLGASRLGRRT